MDPKLNHLEEYKALRDEIMLYQQEMHRTWLWAVIPSGAVYTWLSLHMRELGHVPSPVWFIPAVFVLLCLLRYLAFSYRIERLAQYQQGLEEDVFGKEGLCGVARWNRERRAPPSSASSSSRSSTRVARWKPKAVHPMTFTFGASFVWLGLLVCSIWLSWALSRREQKDFQSALGGSTTAQVSSPAPSQPPFLLSTSAVPAAAASTPTTPQPTYKP
jgi:hypothetical protein